MQIEPLSEDRRNTPRKRMLKSGSVSPDGLTLIYDCIVRNMSDTGARIKVQAQHVIPSTLIFSLKGSSLTANARVIWRNDKELGLEFFA